MPCRTLINRRLSITMSILNPFGSRHLISESFCVSVLSLVHNVDFLPLIADFETAKDFDSASQNKDITDLAFVLLDCMEGHVLPADKRTIKFISQQRDQNKVFGLAKAELWSGSKQLIDFLDELFNVNRSAHTKFTRPVSVPTVWFRTCILLTDVAQVRGI